METVSKPLSRCMAPIIASKVFASIDSLCSPPDKASPSPKTICSLTFNCFANVCHLIFSSAQGQIRARDKLADAWAERFCDFPASQIKSRKCFPCCRVSRRICFSIFLAAKSSAASIFHVVEFRGRYVFRCCEST